MQVSYKVSLIFLQVYIDLKWPSVRISRKYAVSF